MCTGGLAFRRAPQAARSIAKLASVPADKHVVATATAPLFSVSDIAAAHDAVEAAASTNTSSYTINKNNTTIPAPAPELVQEPTNRFSSKIVPPLPLLQLGAIMGRSTACGDEQLMVALVLLVRYCETTGTALTMKMMHRMYIAALHVAIKTHCDRYFRNDAFAMLAGVPPAELNLLEAELIRGVDWRCLVESNQLAALAMDPQGYVAAAIRTVVVATAHTQAASRADLSSTAGSSTPHLAADSCDSSSSSSRGLGTQDGASSDFDAEIPIERRSGSGGSSSYPQACDTRA